MSLIVCVYVPTGIVISADSRTTGTLTQNVQENPSNVKTIQQSFVLSDSTNKVLKVFHRFGIATYGAAKIKGLPIEHYIEKFESLTKGTKNIVDVPNKILQYFRSIDPTLQTFLLIGGYEKNEPFVFSVDIANNIVSRINLVPNTTNVDYGIIRGGDIDIVNRIMTSQNLMPWFGQMNLQDAIDFSRHLVRTTIDQMRFEPKFPTVGGDIDTLIVTFDKAEYVHKKQLTAV